MVVLIAKSAAAEAEAGESGGTKPAKFQFVATPVSNAITQSNINLYASLCTYICILTHSFLFPCNIAVYVAAVLSVSCTLLYLHQLVLCRVPILLDSH